MAKRRRSRAQVTSKLREVDILLAKGGSMTQVCRKLRITEQTCYRWRKEYGGLRTDQDKRLEELEKENTRLKSVVANLALDNAILKEAAHPDFQPRPAVLCEPRSAGRESEGREVCRAGEETRSCRNSARFGISFPFRDKVPAFPASQRENREFWPSGATGHKLPARALPASREASSVADGFRQGSSCFTRC